jgi:GxxExxY protein
MQEGQARAMAADLNEISRKIVDAAVQVHKVLGPGLLESVYRECLVVHELRKRGLSVRLEVDVPIVYDGIKLASTLRLDLLVNEEVIVELKSIEDILAVHRGQLLSYLRLSNKRIGLLINFNVALLKNGLVRLVNNL